MIEKLYPNLDWSSIIPPVSKDGATGEEAASNEDAASTAEVLHRLLQKIFQSSMLCRSKEMEMTIGDRCNVFIFFVIKNFCNQISV